MDAGGIALWILVILSALNGISLFIAGMAGVERKKRNYGAMEVANGMIELFLIYLIIAGGYLP